MHLQLTTDLSQTDDLRGALQQILGNESGEVDAAVDCVGFQARPRARRLAGRGACDGAQFDHGHHQGGGEAGHPRPLCDRDPGAVDEPPKVGSLSIRIGLGWAKSHGLSRASAR